MWSYLEAVESIEDLKYERKKAAVNLAMPSAWIKATGFAPGELGLSWTIRFN